MSLLWQQIALLVVFSGYLLWKHRSRVQARSRSNDARMTGHGFETAELKNRLGDLRERHETLARERRRGPEAREQFARALRASLLRRSFFCDPNSSESPDPEDRSPTRLA
jgi:hypothetical protein